MYLMLKNAFWAFPGYKITPENSLELFQIFFPFFGGFGALGWVFNREILFTAAPVSVLSPKCGIFQPPQGGTTGALCAVPFFPQICIFLRWCLWGNGDLLGYKPEKIWEFPLGMLITEFGCCIHIYILKYPIFWNF